MSWKYTLLPASFRGVRAEVRSVKDTGENALVEHAYPYRAGADVDNLGRETHKVPVEFVLWGADYESLLKQMVTAFEVLAAGELVHPIFGTIQCHAKTWEVVHSAEEYDYCTITVTFVEAGADMPFFNRSLPTALGGLAGLQCMASLDALLTQFESYMDVAMSYLDVGTSGLSLLRGFWDRLMNPLFELRNGVLRLGGDVFSFPRGALSDVMALFGALHGSEKGQFIIAPNNETPQNVAGTGVVVTPSASGFAPLFTRDVVLRDMLVVQNNVQNILLAAAAADEALAVKKLPMSSGVDVPGTPDASAVSPQQVMAVFIANVRAVAVVSAAAELASVFEWELIDPTLSPVQIEVALNQVRRPLAEVVVELRAAYVAGGAGFALSDSLQLLAWQLTAAARAIVLQRPALVLHTVAMDTNVHLLAFKLYGDYRRAYELARLNPSVRNPNAIIMGDVLNVYSS